MAKIKRKSKYTLEEKKIKKELAVRRMMYNKMWSYDPKRKDTLEAAKRKYKGDNKRQKWEYLCAACGNWFLKKCVEVDHIIPRGSYLKPEDEDGFRYRTLNSPLQVLCKGCHKIKSKDDNIKTRTKRLTKEVQA
jgi:5-methylcytosine-specific restriction endonuclease McrA